MMVMCLYVGNGPMEEKIFRSEKSHRIGGHHRKPQMRGQVC